VLFAPVVIGRWYWFLGKLVLALREVLSCDWSLVLVVWYGFFDRHFITAQCFVIIPCWLHCGEWPKCAFICLVGMIFIWRERKKDTCSAVGLLCPQNLKFENFTSSLFISWIKDATFFSHGRKAEVDISQCSLLDFQRNCLYLWKDTWRCKNSSHPLTFRGWKMSHAWDPSSPYSNRTKRNTQRTFLSCTK